MATGTVVTVNATGVVVAVVIVAPTVLVNSASYVLPFWLAVT